MTQPAAFSGGNPSGLKGRGTTAFQPNPNKIDNRTGAFSGNTGVTTPEEMVSMDNYLSSTIKGWEKYVEVLAWSQESQKFTSGNAGGQYWGSALVEHSDISITIVNGGYYPTLQQAMNTGTVFTTIDLVRLGNVGGSLKQIIMEFTYGGCTLTYIKPEDIYLHLAFRPNSIEIKSFSYDQTGVQQGQNVYQFDFTQNDTAGGGGGDDSGGGAGGGAGGAGGGAGGGGDDSGGGAAGGGG